MHRQKQRNHDMLTVRAHGHAVGGQVFCCKLQRLADFRRAVDITCVDRVAVKELKLGYHNGHIFTVLNKVSQYSNVHKVP